MPHTDDTSFYSIVDEAAVTQRYASLDDADITASFRVRDGSATRRRSIRATRQNITRLLEAIAAGWDVRPELAYEEQRLAALEDAA